MGIAQHVQAFLYRKVLAATQHLHALLTEGQKSLPWQTKHAHITHARAHAAACEYMCLQGCMGARAQTHTHSRTHTCMHAH